MIRKRGLSRKSAFADFLIAFLFFEKIQKNRPFSKMELPEHIYEITRK